MANIAKNTVKAGGNYYTPGQEIPKLSKAEREELLAAGAIIVTSGKATAAEGEVGEGEAGEGAKE